VVVLLVLRGGEIERRLGFAAALPVELGERDFHVGVALVGRDHERVVGLGLGCELLGVVLAAVQERSGLTLDDGLDVVAGHGLGGLEGVRHRQHLEAMPALQLMTSA
jgi:hypothetical protein